MASTNSILHPAGTHVAKKGALARQSAHLPSVPPAPGENLALAEAIPKAVHSDFNPKTPFEAILAEEIADLTRRIRQDEMRLQRLFKSKFGDALASEIYSKMNQDTFSGYPMFNSPNEVVFAYFFDDENANVQARIFLEDLDIDIDRIDTRAWINSSKYLDQLNRQIAVNRRQRSDAIKELKGLQSAREHAAIPDAEVISE